MILEVGAMCHPTFDLQNQSCLSKLPKQPFHVFYILDPHDMFLRIFVFEIYAHIKIMRQHMDYDQFVAISNLDAIRHPSFLKMQLFVRTCKHVSQHS